MAKAGVMLLLLSSTANAQGASRGNQYGKSLMGGKSAGVVIRSADFSLQYTWIRRGQWVPIRSIVWEVSYLGIGDFGFARRLAVLHPPCVCTNSYKYAIRTE